MLRTTLDAEALALALPGLVRHGLLGVLERDDGADLYLPDRCDVGFPGEWIAVPSEDWRVRWREGLEPVTVGAFTVAPPWTVDMREVPADVIVIEPGQAFGTGHHETTATALAVLQELEPRGARVLDVGTGSGILAIAAHRLGAGLVVGVDTDAVAIDVARANAAANGAAIDLRLGSVEVAAGAFDVVIANLDTGGHRSLGPQLLARLTPGGVLVAAGISREREDEARTVYEATDRTVEARRAREWVTLVVRRSGG